jgi:hypothetical protein
MEIRALVASALSMAAWVVHHPLTLLHLSPLLQSTHDDEEEEEGEGEEVDNE